MLLKLILRDGETIEGPHDGWLTLDEAAEVIERLKAAEQLQEQTNVSQEA